MDNFINVIKRDLIVQLKIKDLLDKYNRLPYKFQSKIGYDTLIQNAILKRKINLKASKKIDKDIELKKD